MPGIDGLRALAVAAVFVYHDHASWLPGGFLGVDLFFVISGYLITSLLLSEFGHTGRVGLGSFWVRRARRLLPAVFVLIAVCLLAGFAFERGQVELRWDALASIFYVANWRFILEHESYFAQFGRPPLLRHLWSLSVEEQFYLLWPPLLVLGLHLRRRYLVPSFLAVAALASSAWMAFLYDRDPTDVSRVFYGTDTRAGPLLIGSLLAFVWAPSNLPSLRPRWTRRALDSVSMLALGAVVFAFVSIDDHDTDLYHGGFLLLAVCASLLLATVVHPQSVLGRLFARPIPRWLGQRSYAIYLWHWPVLAFTRPGIDVRMPHALLFALQVGVTLLLADLSYRLIERPIRNGALSRLRVHAPQLVSQPRTPLVVAATALGVLLLLAAFTPDRAPAVPPGLTRAALLRSDRASTHPIALPRRPANSSAPPASASGRSKPEQHPTKPPASAIPRHGPVLAVGDSVMLGASSELSAAIGPELRIDAVVSRQADATIDRLFAYRSAGTLPRRVIVHIGDNGPVYYADWQRLKAALAGVPLVILVSVRVDRSWQGEVDREMHEAIAGWRHATIADWYDASAPPGTLVDGTHTSPEGARRFAAVIDRALHHPNLGGVTR
ncbi:MAG TPA: acyltransferase family protein [Gaiellaceae bacterium]|jgi:peptidoglycan/LPS O-acetylase OafA/YrhL|nr:acyltransferase family protein [Gaiellaceae bacterium]